MQGPRGPADLPHWALRDEHFRNLLREAQRQVLPIHSDTFQIHIFTALFSMYFHLATHWLTYMHQL